jgi:hypothetical protein
MTTNKGSASGYAPLNSSSQVPIANLPTGTTSSTVVVGNDGRFAGSAALMSCHRRNDAYVLTWWLSQANLVLNAT